MSVKSEREQRLLAVLAGADSWVTTSFLSKLLGVTERSVRNYIRDLQKTHCISSSQYGYRLEHPAAREKDNRGKSPQENADADTRARQVVSRLLSASMPVSIFDIADDLSVSESTVTNSVMPAVRRLVEHYDIKLVEHDFSLSLKGYEIDKRRLLGYMAMSGPYGYFSSTKTLAAMFPDFEVERIMAKLVEMCQESELLLNNYSLNNLLVHVLIIMIRLKSHNHLESISSDFIDVSELLRRVQQRDEILGFANKIARMFEEDFGCPIPNCDFRHLVLLIALSTDRCSYDTIEMDSIVHLVDKAFLDNVSHVADDTCERYGLPHFDDSFILQLTLHMYNAYQRAFYHVSTPNPIREQLRQSHAPVYDMAVYFTHEFEKLYDVSFSEDEIAFIAFQMGACIERNVESDEHISCAIVVEKYRDFGQRFVEGIERNFGQDIVVTAANNAQSHLRYPVESSLLITTVDLPVSHPHKVLVSPLLTNRDIRRIRTEIDTIREDSEARLAREFLLELADPNLFVRNVELPTQSDYIDLLGGMAAKRGLVSPAFIGDVKLRERVSSTAFVEGLAVPHSISQYARKSFVCILHNDTPIPWERHNVNIVLLFGLTAQDMKRFRPVFSIIVERFSSVRAMEKIMQSDSFDEFIDALAGPAES